MTQLSEHVTVRRVDVRSVNLERDLDSPEPLRSYAPPLAALEMLESVTDASVAGPRLRAWSVIGPYGAGKSSFAHLLASLLGPNDGPPRRLALAALRSAVAGLPRRVGRLRSSLELGDHGALIACATARAEPISLTFARALREGTERYWAHRRGRRPRVVGDVLELLDERRVEAQPTRVLKALELLFEVAPVVLIIDEFGKVLEHAAGSSGGDLYLAQQVAERLSNSETCNGFVLTLQHLAFEDYALALAPATREEWRKVEGRFDSRVFSASPAHAVQMIARALNSDRLSAAIRKAAAMEAREIRKAARAETDLPVELIGDEGTYPLSPLAAPVAATLAGRLGQHDRSLAAFLASGAPHSVPWLLERLDAQVSPLSFIGLHDVYDYFVDEASLSDQAAGGERYREIHGRIADAEDLSELEIELLKAVGALNLAAVPQLRASAGVLTLAYGRRPASAAKVESGLETLASRGLITYRRFADEYRVWEGSDFDVAGRVAGHRRPIAASEPPRVLLTRLAEELEPARAVVARRHSHQQMTLRYFEARYCLDLEGDVADPLRGADGLLLYVLGEHVDEPPTATADGRPIVTLFAGDLKGAENAALELAATSAAAESPELERDAVARREIRHRLGHVQQAFGASLRGALDPAADGVRCFAQGSKKKLSGPGALERLLSDLCDETYPKTAAINSEMLNRREMTSQGAKARRTLISAAFESSGDEHLGLSGWGPERAMLDSALVATGLYRLRDDGHAFGPPHKNGPLWAAWRELMAFFDEAGGETASLEELFVRLRRPPYGMKDGPIPLLVAIGLLVRSEDVMVFQDGSYVPRVGPEHMERLIKTPERFSVKCFPAAAGSAELFEELGRAVGATSPTPSDTRNTGALALLRPMIGIVRALSEHALSTHRVSATAQAVRVALLTTRDPEELLFSALPRACGVDPSRGEISSEGARELASRLGEALLELSDAQQSLTRHIEAVLAGAFGVPQDSLRFALAERADGIEQHVIEPKMRSFVLLAQDTSMDDNDWLDGLAMNLVDRPPQGWSDADIAVFEAATGERARWFARLELLYHEQSNRPARAARLTLTQPDGREQSTLVDADEQLSERMASELDAILNKLTDSFGPGAEQVAISVLLERVLGNLEDGLEPPSEAKK